MKKYEGYLLFWTAVIIVAALILFPRGEVYSADGGLLSYTGRMVPQYTESLYNETEGLVIKKLMFDSRGQDIYALLAVPKSGEPLPAFVVLPGATITKEMEQEGLSSDLNELGFVTLTLDQRGEGETNGRVPDFETDFIAYRNGEEAFSHKVVHDALSAFDILRSLPEVNPARVYIAGISMGGRNAMIAGAIEPGISGVLAISTCGYGSVRTNDPKLEEFLNSINPDNYAGRITPRQLVMIHSEHDNVIPVQSARNTFSLAQEPKKFYTISTQFHGYLTQEMRSILEEKLKTW